MNQEITKKLMCILTRDGVEIWEEEEKLKTLMDFIEKQTSHRFIRIGDNFVNTADISGIFSAEIMGDLTRRKNGQWQGKDGKWYNKGDRVCKCGNVIPFGKNCGTCA